MTLTTICIDVKRLFRTGNKFKEIWRSSAMQAFSLM